jgi:hypothetical protein
MFVKITWKESEVSSCLKLVIIDSVNTGSARESAFAQRIGKFVNRAFAAAGKKQDDGTY